MIYHNPIIKLKKIHPDARIPVKARQGDAGFDVFAVDAVPAIKVMPGNPQVIRTGICVEIPPGWGLMALSRSGQGFKHSVRLANGVGLIDAGYRGEILVKLTADPAGGLTVRNGDAIAQLVLIQVPDASFIEVDELGGSERGEGGFGHTSERVKTIEESDPLSRIEGFHVRAVSVEEELRALEGEYSRLLFQLGELQDHYDQLGREVEGYREMIDWLQDNWFYPVMEQGENGHVQIALGCKVAEGTKLMGACLETALAACMDGKADTWENYCKRMDEDE